MAGRAKRRECGGKMDFLDLTKEGIACRGDLRRDQTDVVPPHRVTGVDGRSDVNAWLSHCTFARR